MPDIQVKRITAQEWETFLLQQSHQVFTQSPQYGQFYASQGEDSWLYGIYHKETLVGGSLVVSVHAKRGIFFYLPYGPIMATDTPEEYEQYLSALLATLKKDGKAYGAAFIRLCPFVDEDIYKPIYKRVGCLSAPMHMLAETTWMLSLDESEDALLKGMKKNHRNLVRRCIKEGAVVKIDTSKEALASFNELHDVTAKRHKFQRFSKSYIEKEFQQFGPKDQAAVIQAYLPDGRLDASAIIMFYGNMAAYRHGASEGFDKKVPTSYLIQWTAIQEAKKRGLAYYNFWGIAPEDAPKHHPFKGITHFKKGFGGVQKDLLHCQDYIIKPTYWINWIIETIRRMRRGF